MRLAGVRPTNFGRHLVPENFSFIPDVVDTAGADGRRSYLDRPLLRNRPSFYGANIHKACVCVCVESSNSEISKGT